MNIVSYFFDTVLLFIFNRTYFRSAKNGLSLYGLIGIYAIAECATAFINILNSHMLTNLTASLIMLFVISLFYEGTLWNRMTGIILFQVLAIMAEMLSNEVLILLPDSNDTWTEGLFISKLILFLLVIIVQFFQKDRGDIPSKYLLCFMLIPFLSMFVLVGVTDNSGRGKLSMHILIICVLMINLISYYILNLLAGYIIREGKALRMQNQIKMQKEKYSQLTAAFSKGNKVLHDVNKHLRYIYQDLENGDIQNAMSYIGKIDDVLQQSYSSIRTGNMVVDSIMSNMHTRLTDAGCECDIVINMDSHKLQMDDYDLVVVLGNIADNQIEAVMQAEQKEKRKAYIKLETAKGNFIIHAKNGMGEKKEKRRDAEKWFHGFGMKNIEETVEKYGGTLSTKVSDGWFETIVIIPAGGNDG